MSDFIKDVTQLANRRHIEDAPIPTDKELAQSLTDALWQNIDDLPEYARPTLIRVTADLLRRSAPRRDSAA